MDPQTLVRRMHEVQVLDIRYPNEWEAGHIDGAVHIPLDDLAERVEELDREQPVVTVCRSGQRSERAAQWLGPKASTPRTSTAGWKHAEGWPRGGPPAFRPPRRTRDLRLHPECGTEFSVNRVRFASLVRRCA